jgi:hypothetical protein
MTEGVTVMAPGSKVAARVKTAPSCLALGVVNHDGEQVVWHAIVEMSDGSTGDEVAPLASRRPKDHQSSDRESGHCTCRWVEERGVEYHRYRDRRACSLRRLFSPSDCLIQRQ